MTGPDRSIGFTRARRRSVVWLGLGLWASGAAWMLSHRVAVPVGEFGPHYRPADAWLLALHGALAFAALWWGGLLWAVHVRGHWARGRRRLSGATLLGTVGLLIVTGYLLYYCGDEEARGWVSLAHWLPGLAAPGPFLVHRFAARRRKGIMGFKRD